MAGGEDDKNMAGGELPVRCPGCGVCLAVAGGLLGRTLPCPNCAHPVAVAAIRPIGELAELQTAPGRVDLPGFHLAFRFIPGGLFRQGNDRRYLLERPAHPTCLTESYWLATTPVTQAAFERVMRFNPSARKGPDLPVEMVSWHLAFDFCHCLAEQARSEALLPSRVDCRLPTEAEWEWAANGWLDSTAGERLADRLDELAWHRGNSGGQTQPVCCRPAVDGLHDLFGNVREWCLDWLDRYDGDSERVCPVGPERGERKVLKGGSHLAAPWRCHPADRLGLPPATAHPAVGFRPVLVDRAARRH